MVRTTIASWGVTREDTVMRHMIPDGAVTDRDGAASSRDRLAHDQPTANCALTQRDYKRKRTSPFRTCVVHRELIKTAVLVVRSLNEHAATHYKSNSANQRQAYACERLRNERWSRRDTGQRFRMSASIY